MDNIDSYLDSYGLRFIYRYLVMGEMSPLTGIARLHARNGYLFSHERLHQVYVGHSPAHLAALESYYEYVDSGKMTHRSEPYRLLIEAQALGLLRLFVATDPVLQKEQNELEELVSSVLPGINGPAYFTLSSEKEHELADLLISVSEEIGGRQNISETYAELAQVLASCHMHRNPAYMEGLQWVRDNSSKFAGLQALELRIRLSDELNENGFEVRDIKIWEDHHLAWRALVTCIAFIALCKKKNDIQLLIPILPSLLNLFAPGACGIMVLVDLVRERIEVFNSFVLIYKEVDAIRERGKKHQCPLYAIRSDFHAELCRCGASYNPLKMSLESAFRSFIDAMIKVEDLLLSSEITCEVCKEMSADLANLEYPPVHAKQRPISSSVPQFEKAIVSHWSWLQQYIETRVCPIFPRFSLVYDPSYLLNK